jgi:hypothetical protein
MSPALDARPLVQRSLWPFFHCDKTCDTGQHDRRDHFTNNFSRLVLDTLTPLPATRKCFRMINGVLVERTVGDVLPQLQSNADNMNKVLVELAKQYKTKQDDMEKWKVRLKLSRVEMKDNANLVSSNRRRTRSRLCSNECEN